MLEIFYSMLNGTNIEPRITEDSILMKHFNQSFCRLVVKITQKRNKNIEQIFNVPE